MSIIKVFIFSVMIPLVLGVFGEELFQSSSDVSSSDVSSSDVLIPLLFSLSALGSLVVIVINYQSMAKKIHWYLVSSGFIIINLVLIFLFFNFHPGF